MKDTKRRYELFSFYDHTGIAAHLEKMAAEGWLLEKIGAAWRYRRIEPKKLTFAVSYYPKADAFDPEPSEGELTFREFCARSGWTLAASNAQMQVFYNEREDPVPIETDPVLEVDTIHRAAKKSFLSSHFALLVIALLNLGMTAWMLLQNPVFVLSSGYQLYACGIYLLMLVMCTVELTGYYRWFHRAKKAAAYGEFLPTQSHPLLHRVFLALIVAAFVLMILSGLWASSGINFWIAVEACLTVFAVAALGLALSAFLKKRKVSAGTNRVVTSVTISLLSVVTIGIITFSILGILDADPDTGTAKKTYPDGLPLTVEDLLDVQYDNYEESQYGYESIFLSHYELSQIDRRIYEQDPNQLMPMLDYSITHVKFPIFYDLCKNALLQRWDDIDGQELPEGHKSFYQPIDPAPWGAQEAYLFTWQDAEESFSRFLLCYEDRIIEIEFDWDPTPEQMTIAGEKLAG